MFKPTCNNFTNDETKPLIPVQGLLTNSIVFSLPCQVKKLDSSRNKDFKIFSHYKWKRRELQTHRGGKACSAPPQDNLEGEALPGHPTLCPHTEYLPVKNIPSPVMENKETKS